MSTMTHQPFGRNFWLAVAALALAGGLSYGQVTGLNDDMEAANTATAAVSDALFPPWRLEARNIDLQLKGLGDGSLSDDFKEIDAALEDL